MKKIISVFLAALTILCVFTFTAFADEKSGFAGMVTVNGESRSYIKNDYFKLNYNRLFERAFNDYNNVKKDGITVYKDYGNGLSGVETVTFDSLGKIDDNFLSEIKSSDDTYYLSVFLNYNENFSAEKNRQLLLSIEEVSELVYVGDTTPCVVIAVNGDNIDKIVECENIEYISYSFRSVMTGNDYYAVVDNGNRTFKPNASQARKILRYAAGLYELEDCTELSQMKEFLLMSDINFDGKITAYDARCALRIAVGIDEPIEFTHFTNEFWGF